ncbi:Acyl-CoA dehydrogenase [Cupriavidus taiwanensis]|uniref:Acyl-CoA dehydrogenase n=1 Tax=Cupriavidus taiwanensis TaxID=164546 RepID=A0A375IL10_9BURK|nr:acyl-CoA dehydrogenase family protein [Cupriavidus taiwanensis]SOY63567.1 Acyl-CoA dehydrogenase [Cupriavidus taiwanensis]SOY63568.1 Acyl-CoA dehydrogenase [Cupriavidus taiwanensis]SOY93736.1 Acyl-CoA dehydrogenase [Cupriavidus taiwanensis]SOZ77368.1 Acyl-CoA dehydrogenase [Cupriavidus taiwanensis]SOZ85415.1 Acyl-CoA dehydrogenase [Cupriavidus taiwanensis]
MQKLTDERRMIQEAARQFTMERVLPIANKLDPEKGQIPRDLIDEMAELGYFGILIPEEYGGLGLGAYEYCLVAEQLSRGWMSVGSLIARGNGLIGALKALTPQKKADYLPRMARGELLGAFSLSEPNAGSDVANISCRAVRDGDDWVITGSKYWCTFADEADFILVICRTDPVVDPKARHKGLSAFMVEKPRGELPAGVKGSIIPKIGYHGWTTWELAFDGCRVPHDKMVGEEGKAFYLATAGLETARAHTAARSIGLAQGSLEDSIQYARDRAQFGNPIASFQAIRFKLADMATQIEAARALLYTVCEKIDEGTRADTEASMVKLFASEMCERVTSEGLQIHGGAGYTTHFAAERYWRDARLTKIFEGTSEIQMRIISDAMLGKIAA